MTKRSIGFICPKCSSDKTHVCDSRGHGVRAHRRRRRFCEVCDHRFSTIGMTVEDYEKFVSANKLLERMKQHTANPPEISTGAAQ